MKLDVEVEGMHLSIPKELSLDGEPGNAHGGATLQDRVSKISGEGAIQPGLDNTIHACPVRVSCHKVVEKNMALQRILAQGEEKLIVPLGIVAGGDIEDDVDKAKDVLDGYDLGMEV